MQKFFWLTDKELQTLVMALLASPRATEHLLRLVEREIKERS